MKPLYLVTGGAAAFGLLFFALPPVEMALLEQPSCFAYIGLRQPRFDAPSDEALRSPLNRAIRQGALQRPKPPYVIVTRFGGEVEFENVMVATRSGEGWQVAEAGRPWKTSAKKLLDFQPLPTRTLSRADGERLEKLLSQGCLYTEPRHVPINAEVHFSPASRTRTYDYMSTMIDVNDGTRSHLVVQDLPSGFNGAVSNIVASGSEFAWVVD